MVDIILNKPTIEKRLPVICDYRNKKTAIIMAVLKGLNLVQLVTVARTI